MLAAAYGVRLGAVGFLTTALFLTHFAVQIPGGRIIDRLGARRVGFGALGAIAAGNALALIAPSFALAIVARLVVGLGTGTGFVAGSDYVRTATGSASAQGLYGGASVAGGGIAIGVVPFLTPSLDWRAPYVSALAWVAAAFVLALSPPDSRHERAGGAPLAEVVRDRRLVPLALVHTASFGFSVILGNWAVPLLVHDGHGRRVAGLVGALTLLGGLVTRPLGGVLLHRRPRAAVALVAASMVAGAGGAVLLLLPLPLAVRVVGSAAVGLAAGVPFAAAFVGAQAVRPDAPAAAVGFVNSAATLTILAGTPLVGFSFSLAGHGRLGFAVVAALWLATFAVPVRQRALFASGPAPPR